VVPGVVAAAQFHETEIIASRRRALYGNPSHNPHSSVNVKPKAQSPKPRDLGHGTAGAPRYALPVPSPKDAQTNVYGSVVATVRPGGEIKFEFKKIDESAIPPAVTARYGKELVKWCFDKNSLVP